MEEYCTVSLKPSTKEKLKLLKEVSGKSYDVILTEILGEDNGIEIEDVIKIDREQNALILNYVEFGESDKTSSFVITYKMLKNDPIGTIYMGSENPNRNGEYVNGVCELIYRQRNDVILLMSDIHHRKGKFETIKTVLHFNVF